METQMTKNKEERKTFRYSVFKTIALAVWQFGGLCFLLLMYSFFSFILWISIGQMTMPKMMIFYTFSVVIVTFNTIVIAFGIKHPVMIVRKGKDFYCISAVCYKKLTSKNFKSVADISPIITKDGKKPGFLAIRYRGILPLKYIFVHSNMSDVETLQTELMSLDQKA